MTFSEDEEKKIKSLPLSLVMCSVTISFVLALRHYYRVLKLKYNKHEIQ